MIIWAASWPRSGSTLFRIIWHTYTGLPTFSYANDPILRNGQLAPFIAQHRLPHPVKDMHKCDDAQGVYLIKTHQFSGECIGGKTMLIIRDVRDAIVSLANYTTWRRGRDFDTELARIIKQSTWHTFNNSWSQVAQAMVKYEDLQADPLKALYGVLEGLDMDLALDPKPLPSFTQLHGILPKFFRRGKAGGWRDVLTEEMEAAIWERNGQYMEQFGYERGQP